MTAKYHKIHNRSSIPHALEIDFLNRKVVTKHTIYTPTYIGLICAIVEIIQPLRHKYFQKKMFSLRVKNSFKEVTK